MWTSASLSDYVNTQFSWMKSRVLVSQPLLNPEDTSRQIGNFSWAPACCLLGPAISTGGRRVFLCSGVSGVSRGQGVVGLCETF